MCLRVNWVWERLQVSCQWAEVRDFSIVNVRAVAAKQVGVNAENSKYCVIQDATSHFLVLINSCLNWLKQIYMCLIDLSLFM